MIRDRLDFGCLGSNYASSARIFRGLCSQADVLMQESGSTNRSTGLPPMMCESIFIDVGRCDVAIPRRIRINHQVRTVLALIQAARLIGSHLSLQSTFCEFLLE